MKRKITFLMAVVFATASLMAASIFNGGFMYIESPAGSGNVMLSQAVTVPNVVNVPATFTFAGKTYTVTRIAPSVFLNKQNITSVTLPGTLEGTGVGAFGQCHSLTSVTLGDGLQKVDIGTFTDCNNLTQITIPNSVQTIGESAFAGCTSLSTVNMGNAVTSISTKAFLKCPITSITLPSTLTVLGMGAFAWTDSDEFGGIQATDLKPTTLTNITCKMLNPASNLFNANAFGMTETDASKTLNVPQGKKAEYEAVLPWKYFFVQENAPTAVESVKTSSVVLQLNSFDKTVTVFHKGLTKGTVTVFDLAGKTVLSKSLTGEETTLSVASLNAGVYLFKTGKNVQKLIVK